MRTTVKQWVWALCAVVCVGCGDNSDDTLSEEPRPLRTFDQLASPGLVNAGACQGDGPLTLRFVMKDSDGEPLLPGARVGDALTLGDTLELARSGLSDTTLSPLSVKDTVICANTCDGDADCNIGLECIDGLCGPNEGNRAEEVCALAGMGPCKAFDPEIDDIRDEPLEDVALCRSSCTADSDCPSGRCVVNGGFCAVVDRGDSVLCAESAACPEGFECLPAGGGSTCQRAASLPFGTATANFVSQAQVGGGLAILMDGSGSLFGRGVFEDERTVKIDRATDASLFRIAAMKSFLFQLQNKPFGEGTMDVAVWSFRGESQLGVRPKTGNLDPSPPDPFVGDYNLATEALDALAQDSNFGRSNVFLGIEAVAQNMIDLGRATGPGSTILVFTDGPDDSVVVSPGSDQATIDVARQQWSDRMDSAIAKATQAGARVIILHLDHGMGPAGSSALAADHLGAMPFPRDKDGRFGPLDAYTQIACATGGQYIYATRDSDLIPWTELVLDQWLGAWEVPLDDSALASFDQGAYRLNAELAVELGGELESTFLEVSQNPAARLDSRGLVFVR